MSIKEQFEKTEKLYHFTSFDTALKIIESNHLRYGRLNNMNDIHENDKIVFVDANNHPTDKFPSDVLDELYDEIYKYRQISLTADDNEGDKDGFDLHQMWGLYADKGEGVCLIFDKKELEKGFGSATLHDRVSYDKTVDSYYISLSNTADKVSVEIREHANEIFFHKRREWEHEQEYRLLRRCPLATREEYLFLGHALKFVILSSRLHNLDEVLYFKKIKNIKDKIEKTEKARNRGEVGRIPVLVYGNGLLDYALCTEDGTEELWNSNDGYDVLIVGENCELEL
ncbi:MAG: DUF2971 domain-containing protein [Lachnospiraceae bacterium]|nr:DUF2971 domain-containing protein [Lachnospiraceae bacterium]